MKKLNSILKMIKFSHTIFAFPFAIVSFFLNKSQFPDILTIILIVLALIFARSAAMAFNRLVDYKYDKDNPRTKNRELVTGELKHREVLIFTIIMSIGFIAVSFFINDLCFYLSPLLLFILFFYSYWKRFSFLCHFYLGMVIALAPVGVDVALNQDLSLNTGMLFAIVTFWVFGFDILYSLLDTAYDKGAKLHSIPSKFGNHTALWISRAAYSVMFIILILLGLNNKFGIVYYIGVAAITVLLLIQHIWVKPNNLSKVNQAFFSLNSYISIIFMAAVLVDLFL